MKNPTPQASEAAGFALRAIVAAEALAVLAERDVGLTDVPASTGQLKNLSELAYPSTSNRNPENNIVHAAGPWLFVSGLLMLSADRQVPAMAAILGSFAVPAAARMETQTRGQRASRDLRQEIDGAVRDLVSDLELAAGVASTVQSLLSQYDEAVEAFEGLLHAHPELSDVADIEAQRLPGLPLQIARICGYLFAFEARLHREAFAGQRRQGASRAESQVLHSVPLIPESVGVNAIEVLAVTRLLHVIDGDVEGRREAVRWRAVLHLAGKAMATATNSDSGKSMIPGPRAVRHTATACDARAVTLLERVTSRRPTGPLRNISDARQLSDSSDRRQIVERLIEIGDTAWTRLNRTVIPNSDVLPPSGFEFIAEDGRFSTENLVRFNAMAFGLAIAAAQQRVDLAPRRTASIS